MSNMAKARPLTMRAGKKNKISQATRRAIFWAVMYGLYLATVVPLAFWWADLQRGYDATGGELLLIILPVIVRGIVETVREMRL